MIERIGIHVVLVASCLTLVGCAGFHPTYPGARPFLDRVQTKEADGLRVSVAVLGRDETRDAFGVDLGGKGIQPVWIEISNETRDEILFLPGGIDREYYSPQEAAYIGKFRFGSGRNAEFSKLLDESAIPWLIPASSTRSGFVQKRFDPGITVVNIDLVGESRHENFLFVCEIPGFEADWRLVDFGAVYGADEVKDLPIDEFHAAVRELPASATNAKGTGFADPVNMVLVGDGETVLAALTRSGWDLTEPLTAGTSFKTGLAFLGGNRYRTAPVSSLYLFGRKQDAAFQKARETVHERNHLRLWLAPFEIDGSPVWAGQISRDIGIRMTSKTWNLSTHKIDPDVDETRDYLAQDLLLSRSLLRLEYLGGVGQASIDEPRRNLTGDPYFTDGKRVVLFLSGDPAEFEKLEVLD